MYPLTCSSVLRRLLFAVFVCTSTGVIWCYINEMKLWSLCVIVVVSILKHLLSSLVEVPEKPSSQIQPSTPTSLDSVPNEAAAVNSKSVEAEKNQETKTQLPPEGQLFHERVLEVGWIIDSFRQHIWGTSYLLSKFKKYIYIFAISWRRSFVSRLWRMELLAPLVKS